LTWEEVERALKKKDASLLVFEAKQTVARVEKMVDLFAPVLELTPRLPNLKGVAASPAAQAPPPGSISTQADEEPKTARGRGTRRAKRKV
jgi:hypothetical protein